MSVAPSARKAAILISALDVETADRLLDHLPAEAAQAVRALALSLDDVTQEERDEVTREFFSSGDRKTPSAVAPGSHQQSSQAREDDGGVELQLSSQAQGDETDRSEHARATPSAGYVQQQTTTKHDPGSAPGQSSQPSFKLLSQADASSLGALLHSEQPQTVAVIVAHLPRDRAAQLLSDLPAERRDEIVRRILNLSEMHPEILHELEQALVSRFAHLGLSMSGSAHGQTILQEILGAAKPQMRSRLIESVEQSDHYQELAEIDDAAGRQQPAPTKRTREALAENHPPMTFADVQRLAGDALFTLFTTVTPEEAILALFDAPEPFVARVLDQLSPRESRVWRYALAHPGPTRLADVVAAQDRLAAAADELAATGQINIPFHHMALVA